MNIIIVVLYVLTAMVAVNFVLSAILIYMSSFHEAIKTLFAEGEAGAGAGMIVGGVFLVMLTLLFHGMFAIVFMASAESIRIMIDIQQNTQESAFYAKQAAG